MKKDKPISLVAYTIPVAEQSAPRCREVVPLFIAMHNNRVTLHQMVAARGRNFMMQISFDWSFVFEDYLGKNLNEHLT